MSGTTIGGDGGNSFPFEQVGASVTGQIVAFEEQQQTNMDTGAPEFWESGQKKLMWKISLATTLRTDPADDGIRSIFARGSAKAESGSMVAAIRGATVAVGRKPGDIEIGGTLTVTYIGDGEKKRAGYNAPKMYSASYVPAPVVPVGGAPPTQAAPAQTAQPIPAQAAALPAPAVDPREAQAAAMIAQGVPEAIARQTLGLPAAPVAPVSAAPAGDPQAAQIAAVRAALVAHGNPDPDTALRGMGFTIPVAAAVDPLAAHAANPQVVAMRAAGVADDVIKSALQLA